MAYIYTASPPTVTKCTKRGYKLVKTDSVDGKIRGWFFECPKNLISLRSLMPNKPKRFMSAEDRAKVAARFLAAKKPISH